MDSKIEIESWFPNISGNSFKIIKIIDFDEDEFNCIAFTLEIYNTFVWPNEKSWPYQQIPRNLGLKGFKMLYELYGYEECLSDTYESGYDKISFYIKDDHPQHAAKQFGKMWRSKCGKYIIEHELDWLCGNTDYAYGDIAFIMKRKI